MVVPVALGGFEFAVGEGFVAEPEGVGLVFGFAEGGHMFTGHRLGDLGGEVAFAGIGGFVVFFDVAVEEGAEGAGEVVGEGEEAGPFGERVMGRRKGDPADDADGGGRWGEGWGGLGGEAMVVDRLAAQPCLWLSSPGGEVRGFG